MCPLRLCASRLIAKQESAAMQAAIPGAASLSDGKPDHLLGRLPRCGTGSGQ